MTKNLTTILSILSLAFMISCSKTAENKPANKTEVDLLVGKWRYASDNVKIYSKGQQTGGGPYTYFSGEYIQFNADGTGRDINTTFTYTISDKTLTVYYKAYISDGDSYPADISVAHIDELGTKNLTLYYDNTFKDNNGFLNGNSVVEYLVK